MTWNKKKVLVVDRVNQYLDLPAGDDEEHGTIHDNVI
jgi:hypothetical protein